MINKNTISLTDLKPGDKVHINFCDTSATKVYCQNGVIKSSKDGQLYVENGIRTDFLKDVDGCYVFLTEYEN
jgi:hypothetical protein